MHGSEPHPGHGVTNPMGMFSAADAATGLAIHGGDPVVAVLIVRRTGGYPDAERAAAVSATGSSHMFQFASLPIRGKMGVYGDIEPEDCQLSVLLALKMSGFKDWASFYEEARNFRDGGGIALPKERNAALWGGAEPEKRLLGLTVIHRRTWDNLSALAGATRESDIETVTAAMADASRRPDTDLNRYQALGLFSLETSRRWETEDGMVFDLPPLARACSRDEGGSLLDDGFRRWLTVRSGLLGVKVMDEMRAGHSADVPAGTADILGALRDAQTLRNGLDAVSRLIVPSMASWDNEIPVSRLALASVETAADRILHRATEMDSETSLDELSALLEETELLRERISARLASARAGLEHRYGS